MNLRESRLWRVELAQSSIQVRAGVRLARRSDAADIGALCERAFRDSVDGEREPSGLLRVKVGQIISGRYGAWLEEASFVLVEEEVIRSVCLVVDYQPYGSPVVAIVATDPARKRSGCAGAVLGAALSALPMLGHIRCCAMITLGNISSEGLFQSVGFSPIQLKVS